MKKTIKIGILILFACLFVTGCGCSKTKYTVEFDSNGGSLVSSQVVEKNGKVKEPYEPTRSGYEFLGWFLDLDDEKAYDFNTSVTSDFTLHAKWEKLEGTGDTCTLKCEDGYELVNGDSADCKCEKKKDTKVDVTGISVDRNSLRLVVGQSATINATVNPANATDKTMTWKSSNEKVVTVKDGKIVAVGVGTAKVTVTAGGKTTTITITVISQEQAQKEADQANLNAALAKMTAKRIERGNTDIGTYTSNGCTITNTGVTKNHDKTVVNGTKVEKLYRATTDTTIKANYNVVCGTATATKTVDNIVPASTYTYTAEYNLVWLIKVAGATNYALETEDGSISGLRYLEARGGVQSGVHTPGTVYSMTLDSDTTTAYAVKSAA